MIRTAIAIIFIILVSCSKNSLTYKPREEVKGNVFFRSQNLSDYLVIKDSTILGWTYYDEIDPDDKPLLLAKWTFLNDSTYLLNNKTKHIDHRISNLTNKLYIDTINDNYTILIPDQSILTYNKKVRVNLSHCTDTLNFTPKGDDKWLLNLIAESDSSEYFTVYDKLKLDYYKTGFRNCCRDFDSIDLYYKFHK